MASAASASMSSTKLSPALKALISSPRALGHSLRAPPGRVLTPLLDRIRSRAESGSSSSATSSTSRIDTGTGSATTGSSSSSRSSSGGPGVGAETWLTLCSAATVTVNSPEMLCHIFDYAREVVAADKMGGGGVAGKRGAEGEVMIAAIMRETALKCISFNGIPRTINALNAFRAHLPDHVVDGLSKEPTRIPTPDNITATTARGRALWDDIYAPLHTKLLDKLASAHPDLPVHILNSHYAALLSDPFPTAPSPGGAKIGRVLTSLVAIACLRAQTGVEPQVLSHVYGLKKALVSPSAGGAAGREEELQGQEWLGSEDGVRWILESTDEIREAVTGGIHADQAGVEEGVKAKL